ncbi:MAG: flagellar hook capping FlgD N-terminal domain-containing protein [Rhodospirillaceae bacterium]
MVGIPSAQNLAAGTTGAVDTKAAATKMIDSMDQFLLMLTTQLKNQDPLSPMESTEFTNQLVGFAQVEQQIGMNTNLQALQGLQRQSQQTMALSYLGRYAEIVDNQVELTDSKAKFAYILENDARTTSITIKNAKGEEVRTMAGKTLSGNHIVEWDGKNNAGVTMPDGEYSIVVQSMFGQETKPRDLTTVVQARISAVSTGDGDEPMLTINGIGIPMSQVRTVSDSRSL